MVACGSVGLANRSTCMCHCAAAAVNSAAAVRPFGKRHTPPGARKRVDHCSSVGRGATARAVTRRAGGIERVSMRAAWTVTGASVARAASRRNVALRWSASTRSNGIPLAIARTIPGRPPPRTEVDAAGASGRDVRKERQRVGDVTFPDHGFVAAGDQVDRAVPAEEELEVGAQPVRCFGPGAF